MLCLLVLAIYNKTLAQLTFQVSTTTNVKPLQLEKAANNDVIAMWQINNSGQRVIARFSTTGQAKWCGQVNNIVCIAPAADNGVLLLADLSTDLAIFKCNADGAIIWQKKISRSAGFIVSKVTESSEGNIFITSESDDQTNGLGVISVCKLNSTGSLLWAKTFIDDDCEWGMTLATVAKTTTDGITVFINKFDCAGYCVNIQLCSIDDGGNLVNAKRLSNTYSAYIVEAVDYNIIKAVIRLGEDPSRHFALWTYDAKTNTGKATQFAYNIFALKYQLQKNDFNKLTGKGLNYQKSVDVYPYLQNYSGIINPNMTLTEIGSKDEFITQYNAANKTCPHYISPVFDSTATATTFIVNDYVYRAANYSVTVQSLPTPAFMPFTNYSVICHGVTP